MAHRLTLTALLLWSASTLAAGPPTPPMPPQPMPAGPAVVPPPPPLPPDIPEEDTFVAPDNVRIIQTPQGPTRIEEYRSGGQLRMVKITPAVGFPYYLIDTDGDGNPETRRNIVGDGISPPMWRLFSW